jgi:hypothetical protein
MDDAPRRLADKLLVAFNQACDQRELDAAELIVKALELVLTKDLGETLDRRQSLGPVVEAYGRLKELQARAIS